MEDIIKESTESDDANDDSSGRRPVLTNDNEGSAAWMNTDKNGNAYVSVRLPLGLGSLNLFPASDEVENALNQLHDHLEGQ